MQLARIAADGAPDFLVLLHNRALRALGEAGSCSAFRVEPGQLATALDGLRVLGFRGLSLSAELQRSAAALCTALSPRARLLGRAALLTFDGESTLGDDVRASAIEARLAALVTAAQTVAVLGVGPWADAAVLAAASLGARTVLLAGASRAGAQRLLSRLQPGCPGAHLALLEPGAPVEADAVIHAPEPGTSTPTLQLDPERVGALLDLELAPRGAPQALAAFRAAGGRGEDGAAVLAQEALAMLEIWRGAPAPAALGPRLTAVVRAAGASIVPEPATEPQPARAAAG